MAGRPYDAETVPCSIDVNGEYLRIGQGCDLTVTDRSTGHAVSWRADDTRDYSAYDLTSVVTSSFQAIFDQRFNEWLGRLIEKGPIERLNKKGGARRVKAICQGCGSLVEFHYINSKGGKQLGRSLTQVTHDQCLTLQRSYTHQDDCRGRLQLYSTPRYLFGLIKDTSFDAEANRLDYQRGFIDGYYNLLPLPDGMLHSYVREPYESGQISGANYRREEDIRRAARPPRRASASENV